MHVNNKILNITSSPIIKDEEFFGINHYVKQKYLPSDIKEGEFYHFGDNKNERAAYEYYKLIRGISEKK